MGEKNHYESNLKTVVSKVNELLAISVTEDDIPSWIQELKSQYNKYQNEVNKMVPEKIRNKNNFVMNLAQNQREKIAAKRMYLLNNTLDSKS